MTRSSPSKSQKTITVMPQIQDAQRAQEVIAGLTSRPKRFPMKYLYMGDVDASGLFEQISEMPDYHVAEAEERLLRDCIEPFVAELQPTELLDLGCGCGLRVGLVLDAMRRTGKLRGYTGVDIARSELERWLETLTRRHPGLEAHGVVGDFEDRETLRAIPRSRGQRLTVMLGQTLGNFPPEARVDVLRKLWAMLDPADPVLIGLDFTEDLEAALAGYDDPEGRNAAFSLNAIAEINRLLGSDLAAGDFAFKVHADHQRRVIVSSLVARRDVKVTTALLDHAIEFQAGEPMLTEMSQRFEVEGLRAELSAAGYDLVKVSRDDATSYGLAVAVPRSANQDRIYALLQPAGAAV